MQLSNEDKLRLNVLLAQPLQAIRINEATMSVHALTDKGEAKVPLNPTTRDAQYLRWVREWLSTRVTGSPGGYPVFLKRWTRMGHARNNLEQMLLLGEPEAVAAVVYTPGISHEIARRAWWADPTTDNARRLLEKPEVVAGALGRELVDYLLEFLPFEEVPLDVVDTVRLCLQGELLTSAERLNVWKRAQRKNTFYVGFLYADARKIPLEPATHPAYPLVSERLADQLSANNPFANALQISLSASGQAWLQALLLALDKPADQEVVIALFCAIQKRFNLPFPEARGIRNLEQAQQRATQFCQGEFCPEAVKTVLAALDAEHLPLFEAMLLLAQLGEDTLNVTFGSTDSIGSVMRKRLEPLTLPMLAAVRQLLVQV